MSDHLVTLAFQVDGDPHVIADWCAELAKATKEQLELEMSFAGYDIKEIAPSFSFLGVFLTKGVKPE